MAIDSPLVSVILPTRNRARLVSRAVRSVLAQTYRNLELIVVDDCSTDETPEVIARFKDERLRYLRLDSSRHAAGARNEGIRVARGELIAFQDDDDVWLVEKLQKQVSTLQSAGTRTGLCLCGHITLYADGPLSIVGAEYFANVQPHMGYGNLSLIATPGWLVRKDVLLSAGYFDERMRTLEDWELFLRLSEACAFVHLDEPLYLQDWIEGNSLANKGWLQPEAMRVVMERHAEKWKSNRSVLSRHYYLIGRMESLHADPKRGRAFLWRSVRVQPGNLKSWMALAMILLGQKATVWMSGQIGKLVAGRRRLARRWATAKNDCFDAGRA